MADIARDDGKDRAPFDHIPVHESAHANEAGGPSQDELPQPLAGVG